jgi:tetrahydromethanopterin S-methyltransferase subunit B
MNIVTDNSAIIETLSNRIVKLEAKIQTAQADKLAAIAIERKRWAREDLVALEILRLEQQAKGIEDAANDYTHTMDATQVYVSDLDCRVVELRNQADALKEPKT